MCKMSLSQYFGGGLYICLNSRIPIANPVCSCGHILYVLILNFRIKDGGPTKFVTKRISSSIILEVKMVQFLLSVGLLFESN